MVTRKMKEPRVYILHGVERMLSIVPYDMQEVAYHLREIAAIITDERLLDRKSYKSMPHGKWTCTDGREILFNHQYAPLYQRRPGQPATPMPNLWIENVDHEKTVYYWVPPNQPWHDEESFKNCVGILKEWGVTEIEPTHEDFAECHKSWEYQP